MSELFHRLDAARAALTPAERRVAHTIERDPSRFAFMTLAQISADSGVSEASVLRFARRLGLDSFTDLLHLLQREMRDRHSLRNDLTQSLHREGTTDGVTATYLRDQENLRITYEHLDEDEYARIVDVLVKARKVGVVGFRASAAPAAYLSFMMNFARPHVVQLQMGYDNALDQLIDFGPGDVIVAFSFMRPSQRTIDIVGMAKQRSVSIVGISDSRVSPLGVMADHALAIGVKGTFFHSYTAVMSVCTALLSGIGTSTEESARQRIAAIERMNKDENVVGPSSTWTRRQRAIAGDS